MIDDWYQIKGMRTTNPSELDSYAKPGLTPRPYQAYVDELVSQLAELAAKPKPFSLIRVGDAEFHFLDGERIGNIGVRHLGGQPNTVDKEEWLRHLLRNDRIALNREAHDIEQGHRYLPADITTDALPVPVVYALVANRALFRVFEQAGLRVGLIGNGHKLAVIRELMRLPEYRNYIGINNFADYLEIPQAGTAAEPTNTRNQILAQIKTPCDVYLLGMGIGKMRILDELRDQTGAILIDIGCGIDAIAGGVCHERPYFADWVNYRIHGYSYAHIDQLDLDTYDHRQYAFRSVRIDRPWYWFLRQWLSSYLGFFSSFRWRRFLARLRRAPDRFRREVGARIRKNNH